MNSELIGDFLVFEENDGHVERELRSGPQLVEPFVQADVGQLGSVLRLCGFLSLALG